MNIRSLITGHFVRYPKAEIADLFKFLYQSAFGCEHLISSPEAVRVRIESEHDSLTEKHTDLIEPLGGGYSRVDIAYIDEGLSAETFSKLFYLSSKAETLGVNALEAMLGEAENLIRAGAIPLKLDDFITAREKWRAQGYHALHHSDTFRDAYSPSYRVISNKFVPFLPLFARLDTMLSAGNVKLAIEGGSASGKSTLGGILESIYECTVFHMDDFFLRPEMRTEARYAEVGGNVDRERFLEEVLLPMESGNKVTFRRFDCATMTLMPPTVAEITPLTVIEGAYSMHPELREHYDLSVFLDISPELQRSRIEKRNVPTLAKRFFEEWIPLENKYFSEMAIRDKCDIVVEIK